MGMCCVYCLRFAAEKFAACSCQYLRQSIVKGAGQIQIRAVFIHIYTCHITRYISKKILLCMLYSILKIMFIICMENINKL